MLYLLHEAKAKTWRTIFGDAVAGAFISRERVSDFFLEIHAIGSLDFDEARRETIQRGAGYAWTPGLRVFDNFKR